MNSPDPQETSGESTAPVVVRPAVLQCQQQNQDWLGQNSCRVHSVTELSSPAPSALPCPRANPGPWSSREQRDARAWSAAGQDRHGLGKVKEGNSGGEVSGGNIGHLTSASTSWWVVHIFDLLRHLYFCLRAEGSHKQRSQQLLKAQGTAPMQGSLHTPACCPCCCPQRAGKRRPGGVGYHSRALGLIMRWAQEAGRDDMSGQKWSCRSAGELQSSGTTCHSHVSAVYCNTWQNKIKRRGKSPQNPKPHCQKINAFIQKEKWIWRDSGELMERRAITCSDEYPTSRTP